MIGDIETTVIGNLAAAPELRFTESGTAVAKFSIGVTSRKREGDKWVDGNTSWVRATAWRELAEHIAESLHKGDRVIALGRFEERMYEKDGEKKYVWEFQVQAIGPELTFATAVVTRIKGGGGGGNRRDEAEWGGASKERPAATGNGQPSAETQREAARSGAAEPSPW